jgi:hypothetical protein
MKRLIALALIASTQVASAQSVSLDNQLYAAYCVGVEKVRIAWFQRQPATTDKKLSGIINEGISFSQERLSRFQQYLLSTDALNYSRDPTGLAIAEKRGESDVATCLNTINFCVNGEHATSPQCENANLLKSPACVSSTRCSNSDSLPF